MNWRHDKRQIIKYALLPGIMPRMQELFGKGFPYLASLIANLFDMMRLLPPGHPYLDRVNYGRFSCLQVIAAAYGELKFEWRYTDRIVAFFAVIAGIVMLAMQFVLLVLSLFITPANATEMPTTYQGFFETKNAASDIAFRMLDMVFGVPGMFAMEAADKKPFHEALQALLQFYSFGILLIGFFLIVYIAIVIVAETAQSGTPFGKRFNKAWAPVRLILFFGLLIPISNGMNAAQYLVLYAAKGGSGLATNGWELFNKQLETPMGGKDALIATPRPPDLSSVAAFVMLAKTCKYALEYRHTNKKTEAWIIYNNKAERLPPPKALNVLEALNELGSAPAEDEGENETGDTILDNVVGQFSYSLRFGEQNPANVNEPGNVSTECGELSFYTADVEEPGSVHIQRAYYEMVQNLWYGVGAANLAFLGRDLDNAARGYAERYAGDKDGGYTTPKSYRSWWAKILDHYMTGKGFQDDTIGAMQPTLSSGGKIGEAVKKQIDKGKLELDEETRKLGWAGAAIWYNKIAQQNGAIVAAVRNFPIPVRYPAIMETVAEQRRASETHVTAENMFNPSLKDGKFVQFENKGTDERVANALYNVYLYWQAQDARTDQAAARRFVTENIIVDTINLFFGTSGLFDMCRNTDIHPLAQLSAMGKGMIDHAIRGFAGTLILGLGGSLLSIFSSQLGEASFAASGMMMTVAGIGLMIGFMLFYLLPFMPFMYFFFAAGAWLKGIFEAVVGAPIWALGHLRIDGQGIAGPGAKDGYFMILEIFLRPILIIFGLLASLIIFSATVKVLNDIFHLVVSNLPAGEEGAGYCFAANDDYTSYARGPIDEFFYTVVYAIVVYMIGMSSFKLIDAIPKNIMRWIGEDVAAYGDQSGDAAEGLMQRVAIGGAAIGGQVQSGLSGATSELRSGFEQVKKSFQEPPPPPAQSE